jgi:hypothetical protein
MVQRRRRGTVDRHAKSMLDADRSLSAVFSAGPREGFELLFGFTVK